jgi:hypothetical protein
MDMIQIWVSGLTSSLSLPYRTSRAFSLGLKLPVRQADHSPPSSAEVKNAWSYTSTPPNTLSCRAAQLKAQGQLHFYFCKEHTLAATIQIIRRSKHTELDLAFIRQKELPFLKMTTPT